MSNTNIKILPIKAPALNTIDYAEGLSGVFDNINTNFSILANKDFIKGDTGESLMIESVKLFENDNFTDYGDKFKTYIEKTYDEDVRKDIIINDGTKLNLFDNIKKYGAELHLIYAYQKDSNNDPINEKNISSLYFVFLDGRFANDKLNDIKWADYLDISDLSGVFIVENDEFKMLPNAFPTMYYKDGVGLCWKFNGNKTGLLVQGPKGNDGKNSPLLIVKANLNEENNGQLKCLATHYYTKLGEFAGFAPEDYADYDGCAAIILVTTEDNSETYNFYFGILTYALDGNLYAYCDSTTGINTDIENASFLKLMSSIDIYNNTDHINHIPGLFVPIKNDGEKTSAHLISATNAIEKNENYKKDLIVTPVDDLDDIDISKVERYLYVKVNKSNSVITDVKINKSDHYDTYLKDWFNILEDECNYILKYKLTNISYNINGGFEPYFEVNHTNGFNEEKSSRFFAKYGKNAKVQLSDITTQCYAYGNNNINDILDDLPAQLLNSMPDSFKARLDNSNSKPKGICRWELYEEKSSINHENIDIYGYNKDSNQDIIMPFKVIYTTDLTPNIDSEIMWFNGISVVENSNNKYIYGFGYDFDNYDFDEPVKDLFKVIKCVSSFNKTNIDTDLSSDTALNINYNVNVIGSTDNFKRDLAVSGDITGKNLTVSGDITGANGKFKVNGSDGTIYAVGENFSLDSSGGITTDGGITTTGNISAAGGITTTGNISAAGGITTAGGKFSVDMNGDITTLAGVLNPKIQYVPIVDFTLDWYAVKDTSGKEAAYIYPSTITIIPGNHTIYDVIFHTGTKSGLTDNNCLFSLRSLGKLPILENNSYIPICANDTIEISISEDDIKSWMGNNIFGSATLQKSHKIYCSVIYDNDIYALWSEIMFNHNNKIDTQQLMSRLVTMGVCVGYELYTPKYNN